MLTKYLFLFAQSHSEFRLPELSSVAELYGFSLVFAESADERDPTRPFMVIQLEKEEHALILAKRCILIKSVYEFYAQGSSYAELHRQNEEYGRPRWKQYIPSTSFKFAVSGFNHSMSQRKQRALVESFAYMGFLGPIDMKKPDIILSCFEEYRRGEGDDEFIQVYFGRLLSEGTARSLIGVFDVKKRSYYGNTSMEAEVSLLMANQTLAAPGKLMYDPFMGTGSMAYPIAHFGAHVYGSDIDGRQMRGKGSSVGVIAAASQYGVRSHILDLCTFDITNNPWRCGDLFDAIVTDPPYGVRAGAKRLGRKKELSPDRLAQFNYHRNNPRPDSQPYIPPTKPYELSNLVVDLIILSRYLLRCNGRLVFFLPTVTDEYEEVDIHSVLCSGMEIVANSLQDFGSWGRRLITIKKTSSEVYPPPNLNPSKTDLPPEESSSHTPAHKDFREKYFQGFRKNPDDQHFS